MEKTRRSPSNAILWFRERQNMSRVTIITIALLCGVSAARADQTVYTHVYRDALRPHGRERSLDQKYADGRACGASEDQDIPKNIRAFQKCMRARGWRLDHVAVTRKRTPADSGPGLGDFFHVTIGVGVVDDDVGATPSVPPPPPPPEMHYDAITGQPYM
jgi:hypothetical protein